MYWDSSNYFVISDDKVFHFHDLFSSNCIYPSMVPSSNIVMTALQSPSYVTVPFLIPVQ